MACKTFFTGFLFVSSLLLTSESAWAMLVIYSQTAVEVELTGYDGLTASSLFKGSVAIGRENEIAGSYQGLALLSFAEGQRYPVIIGDTSFTLNIANTAEPPSFSGSSENDFLYSLLSGISPGATQYDFALLMIQAKQLLESSSSIRTLKELAAKKQEFHAFVRDHYQSLRHSDMVRRLIDQYFMMHEYVDYRTEGTPATGIRVQYQKAVLNGVGSWLEILKPHIPEHEILNYCISFYYKRSMITLASQIVDNFQSAAYCPGVEKESFRFPKDLRVSEANGRMRPLGTIKGKKIVAFVSDDCPVSMVETISKVRHLADQNEDVHVIVAPLQQLSVRTLGMNRMVRNKNILFINDEKWRKTNLTKRIKLPLFVPTRNDLK